MEILEFILTYVEVEDGKPMPTIENIIENEFIINR